MSPELELFLQYVANGIVAGSVYVLVAIGLTLIFGILGVVNFAHGEFYMLGAYAGIVAVSTFGLSIWWALAVVLAVAAVLGVITELVLHRPLRGHDAVNSIISSFGLAVALQNAALLVFGPQPKLLRTDWSNVPVEIGPVFLPMQRAVIPVATAAVVICFHLVLRYTWTGRSLRAMAQHAGLARLCGVGVERVAIVTFIIASVLACVAGMLMSGVFLVHPVVGNMIGLKAFTVVILGGMGNVHGAVAAGLLLGVAEALTAAYLGNGLRDVVGFALVIVVLLLRPQGLFGRSVERS